MSDISVSQNSEMAAMLVSQTILWELNLFLMQIFSFVQWISKAAGHVISHVSENALY